MISIIIPLYNAEKTIIRCLESILNQNFNVDIEIILVNDGSKDNSILIIEEYIEKKFNSNIRVINKKNGGASSARNIGLDESRGDYILFLDSDDTFVDISISYINEIINTLDFDIACFGFEFFDNKNKSLSKYSYSSNTKVENFIEDFLIKGTVKNVIWNKIFKKEILFNNKIKFNSNFDPNEDAAFVFELLLKTKNIIFLDKILYNHISDNVNSFTNNFKSYYFTSAISLLQHIKTLIETNLDNSYYKAFDSFCTRVLCRTILLSLYSTTYRQDYYSNVALIKNSEIWNNLLKSKLLSIKLKFVIRFFNNSFIVWYTSRIVKVLNIKLQ